MTSHRVTSRGPPERVREADIERQRERRSCAVPTATAAADDDAVAAAASAARSAWAAPDGTLR